MEFMFGIDMTPIDSRLVYFNNKIDKEGQSR